MTVVPEKKKAKLALVVRNLHFYASLFAAVMILFFAITGFLATHTMWFAVDGVERLSTQEATVPLEIVHSVQVEKNDSAASPDWQRLEHWLKSTLKLEKQAETTMRLLSGDPKDSTDELSFLFTGPQASVQCVLNRTTASARLIHLSVIPAIGLKDVHACAQAIADELGGKLDSESVYEDQEYHLVSFTVESVWFEAQVQVFTDLEHYHVAYKEIPFVGALINLHRGEHTNTLQTLLSDLTAIVLVFVVFSGVVMGIQMKKRRRMTYIALVVSLIVCFVMIIGR